MSELILPESYHVDHLDAMYRDPVTYDGALSKGHTRISLHAPHLYMAPLALTAEPRVDGDPVPAVLVSATIGGTDQFAPWGYRVREIDGVEQPPHPEYSKLDSSFFDPAKTNCMALPIDGWACFGGQQDPMHALVLCLWIPQPCDLRLRIYGLHLYSAGPGICRLGQT